MECNKSSHLWGTVAGKHCSHAENVCDLNFSAPAVSMPLSPGPQFIFHITWSLGGAQLWLQASDTNVLSTDKRTHDLPCCGSSLWIDFINFAHSLWSHIIWCCSVLLKKNAAGSTLTFAPRSVGLRHHLQPASAASVRDRCYGERPWLAHMLIPSLNKVTQLTKWPSNEGTALHIDALFSKEDLHSNGVMNSRLTTDWW